MTELEYLINKHYGTAGVSIKAAVETMFEEAESLEEVKKDIYDLLVYLNKKVQ